MVVDVMPYRDLSFSHDAVCALSILFVLPGLVVALLVAEQPQGLRALQLNLKLLWEGGGRENVVVRRLCCLKKHRDDTLKTIYTPFYCCYVKHHSAYGLHIVLRPTLSWFT